MISIQTIISFKHSNPSQKIRPQVKLLSAENPSPKMAAHLPPPRIVITSNDKNGRSIIASDAKMPLFGPFGPLAPQFTTLYATSSAPASNTAPLPPSTTTSVPQPPQNGTVFCTSDIPPNTTSAFHRTTTLDYMVVLKGEIVMRLNDGKETVVKQGEMVVQRGTIHAWINRTDQWCRLLCVMLDAEKVVLRDGRVLESAFIPHKGGQ
jgi:quercetin dioxygenase-like cupin family protein